MWKLFLAIVVLLEIGADVLSKEWSLRPKGYLLAGSLLCYLASNVAWLVSLKSGAGLARGIAIFSISGTVLAAVIGLYFYKEQLNLLQLVGVALGIVSLTMIFWSEIFV